MNACSWRWFGLLVVEKADLYECRLYVKDVAIIYFRFFDISITIGSDRTSAVYKIAFCGFSLNMQSIIVVAVIVC